MCVSKGHTKDWCERFAVDSPGYNAIFPKCNDIESMHRHLKDLMFNDRVSTIGD